MGTQMELRCRCGEVAGVVTDDASSLNVQGAGSAINVLSGGSMALRGNQLSYSGASAGTLNVLAGGTVTRSGTIYPQTTVVTPFNNGGLVSVISSSVANGRRMPSGARGIHLHSPSTGRSWTFR